MSFFRTLADFLLPRYCIACGRDLNGGEEHICNSCLCRIRPIDWAEAGDNHLLRKLWEMHDVEAGGSTFYYRHESEFHNIFVMLKYASRPDIARDLARSTFPLWMERGLADGVDMIIPVPLATRKLWHRGYNQAEWVARGVADACKLPLKTDILVRTKNNSTQTHKDRARRKEAMSGVFAVRGNADLNGKTILLVDDIITTGSTIADCIRALREKYRDVRIRVYSLGWSGK